MAKQQGSDVKGVYVNETNGALRRSLQSTEHSVLRKRDEPRDGKQALRVRRERGALWHLVGGYLSRLRYLASDNFTNRGVKTWDTCEGKDKH